MATSRIYPLAAGLALLALLAPPVHADVLEPKPADFWIEVIDPGRKKYLAALERGRRLFEQGRKLTSPGLRRKTLQDAVAALRDATGASPHNAEGWLWLGRALGELEQYEGLVRALTRCRRVQQPEPERARVIAFQLGIAYSKLGKFELAVVEYDRAERALDRLVSSGATPAGKRIPSRWIASWRATYHGNAAEALMALGRLDEAIQRYNEALRHEPGSILTRWGLAVAYDRDEQVSKAKAQVSVAIARDKKMRELTRDGVFFIPPGDIHYYYALGFLAQGELKQSRKHWELFLEKLPDSQWAFRARAHLVTLGGDADGKARSRRLAPTPRVSADSRARALDRRRERIIGRLRSRAYRLTRCYAKALKRKPDLAGKMVVSVRVGSNGRASGVRIVRTSLRGAALSKCVVREIKRIYFGRSPDGKPATVRHTFDFRL